MQRKHRSGLVAVWKFKQHTTTHIALFPTRHDITTRLNEATDAGLQVEFLIVEGEDDDTDTNETTTRDTQRSTRRGYRITRTSAYRHARRAFTYGTQRLRQLCSTARTHTFPDRPSDRVKRVDTDGRTRLKARPYASATDPVPDDFCNLYLHYHENYQGECNHD